MIDYKRGRLNSRCKWSHRNYNKLKIRRILDIAKFHMALNSIDLEDILFKLKNA
jgi:hypothetical protein